jgi:hypothetical protein
VFAVRYELGSYIPEDDILHNHRLENLKSYIDLKIFSRGPGIMSGSTSLFTALVLRTVIVTFWLPVPVPLGACICVSGPRAVFCG